jgi:hypothetical protein
MSVIKIELQSIRAEQLFAAVEKLAELKELPPPALTVELEAGAVAEQISYIKNLLVAVEADDGISDKSKTELSDFLASMSLSLKRALQGTARAGGLTASRVHKGHCMPTLSGIAAKDQKPMMSIEVKEG